MSEGKTTDWRDVFAREALYTESNVFRARLLAAVADARVPPRLRCRLVVRSASAGALLCVSASAMLGLTLAGGLGLLRAGGPGGWGALLGAAGLASATVACLAFVGAARAILPFPRSWRQALALGRLLGRVRRRDTAALITGAVLTCLLWWAGTALGHHGEVLACETCFPLAVLGAAPTIWSMMGLGRVAEVLREPVLLGGDGEASSESRTFGEGERLHAALRGLLPTSTSRPTASELADALRHPDAPGWAKQAVADAEREEPQPLDILARELAGEAPFGARMRLWQRGTQAIAALLAEAESTRPGAERAHTFAVEIGQESLERFGLDPARCVCVSCLRRLRGWAAKSWRGPVPMCACPACGGTHAVVEHPGEIVLVLDSAAGPEAEASGGSLRGNWLARAFETGFEDSVLFDFDRVEIVRATDAEVRHFLVDVANDTDPVRKRRYPKMRCEVAAGCALSEATTRQLRSVFGEVIAQE